MATDTRQKLIETAIDLIWQSSYGAVSVDDICRAAGVKKGSFYHFFPSKAELAVAAIDDHFLQKKPDIDAVFSDSVPPLKRFENLADMIITYQEQAYEKYGRVCGCPFAALGSEMAGQDEAIRRKSDELIAARHHYCEKALADAIAQGLLSRDIDAPAVAGEVCTYIMGQMMMARIQNSLDGVRRELKQGIFRVIGVRQEEFV